MFELKFLLEKNSYRFKTSPFPGAKYTLFFIFNHTSNILKIEIYPMKFLTATPIWLRGWPAGRNDGGSSPPFFVKKMRAFWTFNN
jgi:hypothetical protein